MNNIQKTKISILLVEGQLPTNIDPQEIVERYKKEFNESIAIEDAEDCLISLRADNEIEQEQQIFKYLEMKT